jgi:hypothetical protein
MGKPWPRNAHRVDALDGGCLMPPVILFIAGAAALGYLFDKGADAANATAGASKWAFAGGALFVAYKGAQTAGLIR